MQLGILHRLFAKAYRRPYFGRRNANLFLAILMTFVGKTLLVADNWYDPAWPYRQEIEITASDYGSVALNDFPFLIKIDGANPVFSKAKLNGQDIFFTDVAGQKIDYEIEAWQPASSLLRAWLRIPNLPASGDSIIYMYYGNPAAPAQENAHAVWDSNYKMVHHLDETGSIYYDSTDNAIDGLKHNNTVNSGSAPPHTGKGQEFKTNPSYIDLDNINTDTWSEFTIEAWIRPDSTDNTYPRFFSKANTGADADNIISFMTRGSGGNRHLRLVFNTTAGSTGYNTPTNSITPGSWYHVAASINTANNSLNKLFINGVSQTLTTTIGPNDGPTLKAGIANQYFVIGNATTDPTYYRHFDGAVDELRFSNVARSADWIAASYTNQNNPKGGGNEQVFIGGRVYADEGHSPLAGASIALIVEGTLVDTAISDANGYWGKAIDVGSINLGDAFLAYISTGSVGGGTLSRFGGENLYNIDIYAGSVIVRNDNGSHPKLSDIHAAGGGSYTANWPIISSSTSDTELRYKLFIPEGESFDAETGSLFLPAVVGPGNLNGNAANISVDGNFTPGSFTAGTSKVIFTDTGNTASYSFYDLSLDLGTRTATGNWTIVNSLSMNGGSFNPGSFTHSLAGNWDSSEIAFAPTAGTIQLTGTGTISGNKDFWNLEIKGKYTLSNTITVKGDIVIQSEGELTISSWLELHIQGNWTNYAGTGGFKDNAGQVSFENPDKTTYFTGDTIFRDFFSNKNGKILAFEVGSTQEVTSALTIGENVSLISWGGSGNDQWYFEVSASSVSLQNIKVGDSHAIIHLTATGTNTDLGNNTGWSGFTQSAFIWNGNASNGDWSDTGNWDDGAVPTNNPTVIIPSGLFSYPEVGTVALQNLSIAPKAWLRQTSGTINIYDQYDLQGTLFRQAGASFSKADTNSGTVVYEGSGGAIQDYGTGPDYFNLEIDSWNETFTHPSGQNLHVAGDLIIRAGSLDLSTNNNALQVDGKLIVEGSGKLILGSGNVDVAGSVSGMGNIVAGSATISLGGDWLAGNVTPATSRVILTGSSAKLAAGSFFNISIESGAVVTQLGDININGSLELKGKLVTDDYQLNIDADLTSAAGGSLEAGNSTIFVGGNFSPNSLVSHASTIHIGGNFSPGSFSPGSGSIHITGSTTLSKSLAFNNLSIDEGAELSTDGNTITINGVFTNLGTLRRSGSDFVSKTDASSGLVVYADSAGGIQTYAGDDYFNLKIEGTYSLAQDISVRGNILIDTSVQLNLQGNTILLYGNWENNGTQNVNGRLELMGSGESQISGSSIFTHVSSSAAGKQIILNSIQYIATGGSFEISGLAGSPIELSGASIELGASARATAFYANITDNNIIGSGGNGLAYFSTLSSTNGWDPGGHVWTGDYSTDWQTANNWNPETVPGPTSIVSIPAGVGHAPQLTANTNVQSLSIENGASLDIADFTLHISGTFNNLGTLYRMPTTTAVENKLNKTDTTSGTTVYYGTGGFIQDYGSLDYYNLVIGDASKAANTSLSMNFNLGLAGNLHITADSTFNAGSNRTITIAGNFINDGSYSWTSGNTVLFNDATKPSTIGGNSTFHTLSTQTPGKRLDFGSSTQRIASGGSISFMGSSARPVELTGSGWSLDWNTTGDATGASVEYASIKNSTVNTLTIANSSLDNGGNKNWSFAPGPGYFIWTGAVNADWSNLGNWSHHSSEVVYPGGSGASPYPSVFIPATATPPVLDFSITSPLGELVIENGASLDIKNNSLMVSGSFRNEGTLYRESGAFMNVHDASRGHVVYRGNSDGSIQDYGSGFDYWRLSTEGTANWTSSGNLLIGENLSLGSGSSLRTGSHSLEVRGTSDIKGQLLAGSGAINFKNTISIDSGASLQASSTTSNFNGDISILAGGNFQHNGGLAVFTGAGNISGNINFYNLAISNNVSLDSDINVLGNINLISGLLNLNDNTLSLAGNLSRTTGTFNSGTSGKVALVDAGKISKIGNGFNWPNLEIITAGKMVEFLAGSTQSIAGNFIVTGASGNPVLLRSSSSAFWTLQIASHETVKYVDVSYSQMTGSLGITANNSIDSGNNGTTATPESAPGWYFPRSSSFTWTGAGGNSSWDNPANWAEGSNGNYPGSDNGSGTATVDDEVAIPGGASYWPTLNTGLTIKNLTVGTNAELRLDAALTISGNNSNRGSIVINNNGSLSKGDNSLANGGTIVLPLTVNRVLSSAIGDSRATHLSLTGPYALQASGNFDISGNINIGANSSFTLTASSGTYSIGGNVTGPISATLDASALTDDTLSIGGSLGTAAMAFGSVKAPKALQVGGTVNVNSFTHNTGTLTITGSGTLYNNWTIPARTLHNLEIDTAATITAAGNISVGGTLTFTRGSLDMASHELTLGSNLSLPTGTQLSFADGTFTAGSHDISVNGGNLTLAGTSTLSTTGSFTISGTGSVSHGSGAFSVGDMSLTDTANFTQTGDNGAGFNQELSSLSVGTGTIATWDADSDGGSLSIVGDVNVQGILAFNQKNVQIGGSLSGNIEIYDLYIPAGWTLTPAEGTTLTVRRSILIEATGFYNSTYGPSLMWGGPNSVTGGSFNDANTSAVNMGNLVISGNYDKTLASHLAAGSLNITGQTLNAATYDLQVTGSLTGTGSLNATGNQDISVGGNFTINTFNATSSTVTLVGNSDSDVSGYTFNNLIIDKSDTAKTITAAGGINVGGTLSLTRGSLDAGNHTHTIAGNWDSSSSDFTFNQGSSTVVLSSANPSVTQKSSDNFYNLTHSVAGTLSALSNLNIEGELSNGATINLDNYELSFGTYTGNGSISIDGGSLTTTGDGGTIDTLTVATNANINGGSGTVGIVITNAVIKAISSSGRVSLNGTGITSLTIESGTLSANGDITASGALTNNGILALGAHSLSFGTYTGNGSDEITTTTGSLTTTGDGGTIDTLTVATNANINGGSGTVGIVITNAVIKAISSSGRVSLNGTDITDLTISSGTLSANGNITASGALSLDIGTNLAMGNNALSVTGATANAGSITLGTGTASFTGTVTNTNGSITGGSGDLVFAGGITGGILNATGSQNISVGGDFTIGSFVAANSTVTLVGNWDVESLDAGNGSIRFIGDGDQNIISHGQTWHTIDIATRSTGNLVISGLLLAENVEVASGDYNIAIEDGGTVNQAISFNNSGTLNINTDDSHNFTATAGLNASIPELNTIGSITSVDADMIFGRVDSSGSLSLSAGSGDIQIQNNISIAESLNIQNSGVLRFYDSEGSDDIDSVNISVGGNFVQQGASNVELAADLYIGGQSNFTSPILLIGNVAAQIDGSATFANIQPDSNGAWLLNIDRASQVNLSGNVGQVLGELASLEVTSSDILIEGAVLVNGDISWNGPIRIATTENTDTLLSSAGTMYFADTASHTNGIIESGLGGIEFASHYQGEASGSANPSLVGYDSDVSIHIAGDMQLANFVHRDSKLVFIGSVEQSLDSNGQILADLLIDGAGLRIIHSDILQTGAERKTEIKSGYIEIAESRGWLASTTAGAASASLFKGMDGSLVLHPGTELRVENIDLEETYSVEHSEGGISLIRANGDVSFNASLAGDEYSLLRMTGSANTLKASSKLGFLEIAGQVELGSAISLNQNLDIESGGQLDVGVNNYNIRLAGHWRSEDDNAFNAGEGEVLFTRALERGPIEIRGSNSWYVFSSNIKGQEIQFEKDKTQTFLVGGKFQLLASEEKPIRITRLDTDQKGDLDWLLPDPPEPQKMWQIDLLPGASLDFLNVIVAYSDARAHAIRIDPSMNINLYLAEDFIENISGETHMTAYRWLKGTVSVYSYTEDANHNGRIDRIRVTSAVPLNMDFSSFDVEVVGYDLDRTKGTHGFEGISSGEYAYQEFYIYLMEKTYLDTGHLPAWKIISPEGHSLRDASTELQSLSNFEEVIDTDGYQSPTDTAPPIIAYTLALPGYNQRLIVFSEPVFTLSSNEPEGSDLGGRVAENVSRSGLTSSISEYLITMDDNIGWADIRNGSLLNISVLYDAAEKPSDYSSIKGFSKEMFPPPSYPLSEPANALQETEHPISDLLISREMAEPSEEIYFTWPMWAKDSVVIDADEAAFLQWSGLEASRQSIGLVRAFDGSQWLRDQDFELHARSLSASDLPSIVYDSNVDSAWQATAEHGPVGLWLPEYKSTVYSSITPEPNPGVSIKNGSTEAGDGIVYQFIANDPKVLSPATLDFFFRYENAFADGEPRYGLRLEAPLGGPVPADWYRCIRPFSLNIQDVITQRGRATILNNVINPTRGETTRLSYQLHKAGPVSISVYTLDGSVVRALYRGSRAAGDYTAIWDGRNTAGRIVARGLYFIRIVGPDMDEIRKVMVVK